MSVDNVSKKKKLEERWHVIQNAIYSVGASVVIIGALFKLMHWNYAGTFLSVGLITEAIIFLISAFEKPLETPDWKKVYRELNDDYDPQRDGSTFSGNGQQVGTTNLAVNVPELPKETMDRLRESIESLASTAQGLKDMTDASAATTAFANSINEASVSINKFSEKNTAAMVSCGKAAETISQASEDFTTTIGEKSHALAQSMSTAGASFDSAQKDFSSKMSSHLSDIEKGAKTYSSNIDSLSSSVSSLKSSYDKQEKGSETVEQRYISYAQKLEDAEKSLEKNIEGSKSLDSLTQELGSNIKALNSVYGNMLGALNVKK